MTGNAPYEIRRAELQQVADTLEIDAAFIDQLVETFYARVREHARLSPIFNTAIGDRWPEHLTKLKAFWRSVALGTREYDGRPVPAHMNIGIHDADLFADWLMLFRETLDDLAPTDGAKDFFLDRASMMAKSLTYAVFGLSKAGE